MKLTGKQRVAFCFEVVTIVAAIVLVAMGSWIHSASSEWLVFAGIGLFLIAGLPALRALAGPWTTEDLLFDRKSSTKKISNGIVALSSAAILAVYAAGYHHTSSAADRFEAQNSLERHRNTSIAAALEVPAPQSVHSPVAEASRPIPIASVKPVPPKVASSTVAAANVLPEENIAIETPALPQPAAPQLQPPVSVAAVAVPEQAPQPVVPVQGPEPPQSKYLDGTYFAWGSCRHGSLQVKLIIEAGRIASADIEQCRTRYSCSVIRSAPPQLVSRQTPEAIDNVSGATQSVDAYYDAVSDALHQATRSEK